MSRWATDAWTATGARAKLWYATLSAEFHRTWGETNDRVGLWAEQPEPPCTPRRQLAWHRRLPDDILDQKIAALEAHRSQTSGLIEMVGRDTYREWWRYESFRAATRSGRATGLELPRPVERAR